jgi:hypothetical protein
VSWQVGGWATNGPSRGGGNVGWMGQYQGEAGFWPTGHAEKRKSFLISKFILDLEIHLNPKQI